MNVCVCGRLISVSRGRDSEVLTLHLVFVQQRLADDVLTDGGGRGQAVQPVEELHAGDVLLSALRVQLAPQNLGHRLGGQGATCLLENTKQTTTTTTIPSFIHSHYKYNMCICMSWHYYI